MASSLKEKLVRLNRIHLGKKGGRGKAAAVRNKVDPTPPKSSNCQFSEFEGTWPQIHDDTITFWRETGDEPSLEAAVPAQTLLSDCRNRGYFHIRRDMDKFWKRHGPFMSALGGFTIEIGEKCQELGISTNPEDWCFLDLETCGFSGSSLFLIGCAGFKNGSLVLNQFFSRDYDEESPAIAAFWRYFKSFSNLVTFNGKSFDWPFLEERTYVQRQTPFQPRFHLDLLHLSRKKWKAQLPNCRLQTLERVFCRRTRVCDIPGSQIPRAYHDFVSKPEHWQKMGAAVHHNALDVITMAEILLAILTDCRSVGAY